MTAKRLPALFLCLCLAAAGSISHAAGGTYSVTKTAIYFQTSGSGAAAGIKYPYNFEAVTAIAGATLMFPGGSTQVVPYDANDSEYDLSESFATKAALDATYPDGTYQVTGSGIPTLTLSLTPDSYPPTVPSLTNSTWSNGIFYVNPAAGVTLDFSDFSTYGTVGAGSYMQVNIQDQISGGPAIKQQIVSAANSFGIPMSSTPLTSYTIPAGTLTAGDIYELDLKYGNFTAFGMASGNGFASLFFNDTICFLVALPSSSTPPPVIASDLTNQTGVVGGSATMSLSATVGGAPIAGAGKYTVLWYLNGQDITPDGVKYVYEGGTLLINNLTSADAGTYGARVINQGGMVLSAGATLTVVPAAPPSFTLAASPAAVTVASGRSVVFNTIAAGAPAPTYQWTLNTVPISGATDPILLVSGATSVNAGTYTCTATNTQGSVSTSAVLTVTTTAAPGYLTNLSSRAVVGTGANILIAGFGISGSGALDLLLRGGGPTLAAPPYNGTGYITFPQLTLFDTVVPSNPQPIVTDVAWGSPFTLGTSTVNVHPQIPTTVLFDTVGAYDFNVGSADSAIEVTPPVGNYTAQISGVSGVTGIVLAEIYDVDAYTPSTKLVNISTRASVGTGANILIGGFVIGGTTAETLLIRAIGPTLTQPPYNGTGYITNPQLTLYAGSTPIYSNTGWGDDATISAAFGTVGAFALNPTSADSVLLVTLPPASNYTAQVSGVNNGTGIALMEIYEVQ